MCSRGSPSPPGGGRSRRPALPAMQPAPAAGCWASARFISHAGCCAVLPAHRPWLLARQSVRNSGGCGEDCPMVRSQAGQRRRQRAMCVRQDFVRACIHARLRPRASARSSWPQQAWPQSAAHRSALQTNKGWFLLIHGSLRTGHNGRRARRSVQLKGVGLQRKVGCQERLLGC